MRTIATTEIPRNNRGGRVLIPHAILLELVASHNALVRMQGGTGIRASVKESGVVVELFDSRAKTVEAVPDLGDSGDGSLTSANGYSVAIKGIRTGTYPVDLAAPGQTLMGMRMRCNRTVSVQLQLLDVNGVVLKVQTLTASGYSQVTFETAWNVATGQQLQLVVNSVTPTPTDNEEVLAGVTIF